MQIQFKTALAVTLFTAFFMLGTLTTGYVHDLAHEEARRHAEFRNSAENIARDTDTLLRHERERIGDLGASKLLWERLSESNARWASLPEEARRKEIDRLDRRWREAADDDPFVQGYLTNDVARQFRECEELSLGRCGEIFVTDRYGVLVGASARTGALAYGQKYWWQAAWADGAGKVAYDDRGFDPGGGDYVLGVVLPIRRDGEVIGLLKGNVRIFESLNRLVRHEALADGVTVRLARATGEIVAGSDAPPFAESLAPSVLGAVNPLSRGSFESEGKPSVLYAYAVVPLTGKNSEAAFLRNVASADREREGGASWFVLVSQPTETAFRALRAEAREQVALGLAFLLPMALLAFLLGRRLGQPIVAMAEHVRRFAAGETVPPLKLERKDEIGRLGGALDRMTVDLKNLTDVRDELNREIVNRVVAEAELEESLKKYRSLFENMRDGFAYCRMIYDEAGAPVDWVYLEVNDSFEEIVGIKRNDIVNRRVMEVFPSVATLRPDLREIYGAVASTGENAAVEVYFEPLAKWLSLSVYSSALGYFVAVFDDITDRKRDQLALKAEKERAQRYLDVAGVMLIALDRSGIVTLVNQRGCQILKVDEKVALGQNWFDRYVPEETVDETKALFARLMAGESGQRHYHENEVVATDGERRLIAFQNTIVFNEWGEAEGVLSSGEDITERRRAERALAASERKLAKAQTIARLGSFAYDPATGTVEGSPELYAIVELPRDAVDFGAFFARFHPEDAPLVGAALERALEERKGFDMEYRLSLPDGRVKWVHLIVEVAPEDAPEGDRIFGTVRDITERKAIERTLLESERRLRVITDSVNDAIIMVDTDGVVRFWNRGAEKVFQYGKEAIGSVLSELIVPERYLEGHREGLARFRATRTLRSEGRPVELTGRRKDGREIPLELSLSSLDLAGELFAVGVIRDITVRRQTEARLQRLALAVDSASEGILVTDGGMIVTYVSAGYERLTGWGRYDILGSPAWGTLGPGGEKNAPMADALERGEPWQGRLAGRVKGGGNLKLETTISPFRSADGVQTGYIYVLRDITREQSLEAQLRESQKMEAVGTLAGGIAHDFNNMLFAILGYASLAQESLPEESPTRDDLQEVLDAGNRAKELVAQILAFSRRTEATMKPFHLHLAVKEALKLVKISIPPSIRVVQKIAVDDDVVEGDPGQLQRVVMNLVINGVHAIGERDGALEITLAAVEVDEAFAALRSDLKEGPYALLSVRDSGKGIAPEDIGRIFEPFFTTKKAGEGTGMGLAAVQGIVATHHGAILVESKPGEGARFDVYLPRLDLSETDDETVGDEEAPGGRERLLVVDDDPSVCELIETILSQKGYRVEAKTDSVAALELFLRAPDDCDLVITDYSMPKMSGETFTRAVLSSRSDLPVIMLTGFLNEETMERIRALGVREILFKPVIPAELKKTVRRLLDERDVGE